MKHAPSDRQYLRPTLILLGVLFAFALADHGDGEVFTKATLFSAFETFAAGGLVSLGLGVTMIAGEFDLSVVGVFSLAGCVAVLTGGASPFIGVVAALCAGLVAGALQGFLITRLRLSSVGVTLGGMLTCNGLAAVITQNQSIPYDNMNVALDVASPIGQFFSIRSLIVFAIFGVVGLFGLLSRYGRDIIALGSDRRAATTAGVPVNGLVVAIFAFSGCCAALSGALASYSLASASPSGLSDVILPAAASAILGGVSLGGGSGRPFGIMIGALTLSVLRTGLNALGAPPFVNDIAMGAVLMAVSLIDSPLLARRLARLRVGRLQE
jgi:ribose/xylose/arabinose/galactoside ABC-type transport system permease subunit